MRFSHLTASAVALAALIAGCDTPVINLTEPPVTVETETAGAGRPARPGDFVTVDYRITLPDGKEVISGNGYRFRLGEGTVIRGVDNAVEGMRAGGRRVVQCPPHLHWGRQGYGDGKVPPNTTLTIDVRLRAIQ